VPIKSVLTTLVARSLAESITVKFSAPASRSGSNLLISILHKYTHYPDAFLHAIVIVVHVNAVRLRL
jgi:hypothetical protein